MATTTSIIPMELRFDHDPSRLEAAQFDHPPMYDSVLARVVNARTTQEAARIIAPSCLTEDSTGWAARAMAAATVTGILAAPLIDAVASRPVAAQGIENPAPHTAAERPPKQIVIFDDSIGVGRRDYGYEEPKLEAAGLDVTVFNAVGGRQTAWEMCDTNPQGSGCTKFPDVITAMADYPAEIAAATAVVIRTGTNDGVADLEEDLMRASRMATALGTADGSEPPLIILANTFGLSDYVDSDQKNPIIARVSDRLTAENIANAVIDYRSFVDSELRPAGGMASDEVHPNASIGYPMMADHDKDILPQLVNEYYDRLYPAEPVPPEIILPPVVIPPSSEEEPLSPPQAPETPSVITPAQPDGEQPDAIDYLNLSPGLLLVAGNDVDAALEPANIARFTPVSSNVIQPLSRPKPIEADTETLVVMDVQPAEVAPERIVANVPVVNTATEIPAEELVPVTTDESPVLAPLDPPRSIKPAQPPKEPTAPSVPETPTSPEPARDNETIMATAEANGIFYDEQGVARMQLHDFVDRDELPNLIITEGFGDYRELEEAAYRQGNEDISTQSSTSGRRDVQLISPGPGIYHEVYTEGEGLKVFIELGISERTGNPWFFYNTHMSESIGAEGQVVMMGDVLGRAGMTGLVVTSNPIFSVGLTDQFTLEQMHEYANSSEAVNPHDYSVPGLQFTCRPTALDDPGKEFCGPTKPGVSYTLPVNARVLEQLGIPAQLDLSTPEPAEEEVPDEVVVPAAPEDPEAASDGLLIDFDSEDLPAIDELVPEVNEDDELVITEPDDGETEDDKVEPPVIDVEPGAGSEDDTDLPPVSDDEETSDDEGSNETPETPDEPAEPKAPEQPEEPAAPAGEEPPAEEPAAPAPAPEAPMRDIFTDAVVQAILPGAPMENIQAYTPLVLNALAEFGIADPVMGCYTFGTIRPETGGFAPIPEISRGRGNEYGKPDPQTGHTYYGRGFVQLTWRSNYEYYGNILGIDLLNNPDLALEPTTAARVMALYLLEHQGGIRDTLGRGDYRAARQIVNGRAAHGLEAFTEAYLTCAAAVGI